MAVNWGLLQGAPNAGESFAQAFQQGQQTAQANMAKSALAALVQDPNNPKALAALARVSPETAMQFRTQQAQLVKEQLAQHQDNIIKGAQILRQFMPKDQASYSAALQAAAQAGIDLTGVPQQFNPEYVNGVVQLANALKPENTNPDQVVVTPQPNAPPPVIYNKQTGEVKQIFAPNDGSHQVGAPVPITATGPNGEKIHFNPQSGQWEPMGGATGAAPSPTFR